jgi:hypothetical protein
MYVQIDEVKVAITVSLLLYVQYLAFVGKSQGSMTTEIRLSASAHANVAFKEIQPNTAKFSFFHISLQQTNMERNHEKESEKIDRSCHIKSQDIYL